MTRKKREIVTFTSPSGDKRSSMLLPEGVRACDVQNINCRDEQVIAELALHGRHSRNWFVKRGLLSTVKRLKARGFIESVRKGSNYNFDLTPLGYAWVDEELAGVKDMDITDHRDSRKSGVFC